MLGSDLAEQIRDGHEGTRLGDVMASIAAQVEEDRQTLLDLMERMGTSKTPVKQATGWIAEKASRAKFSGITSRGREHGAFMALESLTLGVEGNVEGVAEPSQRVSSASRNESRRTDQSR